MLCYVGTGGGGRGSCCSSCLCGVHWDYNNIIIVHACVVPPIPSFSISFRCPMHCIHCRSRSASRRLRWFLIQRKLRIKRLMLLLTKLPKRRWGRLLVTPRPSRHRSAMATSTVGWDIYSNDTYGISMLTELANWKTICVCISVFAVLDSFHHQPTPCSKHHPAIIDCYSNCC